ncbi:enhanced level of genomic instability 1 [Xylocopa sonorina]|uniref:enhanced level of genomic instability 1 n=1 Tax=Xylocopa sonorina TaxID=1818115 RepID=UPI00403B26AC
MKNIAQYFEDTVKSNDTIPIHSNDDAKGKLRYMKDAKGKRNRVKIKISRTKTKERTCDIIESSSDMIDKTPSPFAKENNMDKDLNETPKSSSLSNLPLVTRNRKLTNQRLNYLALETNDYNVKMKRKVKNNNIETYSNGNKCKKKLSNKVNSNKDVSINSIVKKKEITNHIELINVDSDNDNDREQSNAFQILMGHTKPIQCVSPTKIIPQSEEANLKKSCEYKEKLKRSKEKSHSKKKLVDAEESEKIEQSKQNHIKLFKGQEKKDNGTGEAALNYKQQTGTLLNYFSKTPVDLAHPNVANITTIVVKADVHTTENNVKRSLRKPNIYNEMQSCRKNIKSNLKYNQMDDIIIIDPENTNILNNKTNQQDEQQHNKHEWLLPVKMSTYTNENALSDESSDEEIFSSRSKTKLNMEDCKKSQTSESMENLSVKNKNKKEISKQSCKGIKLKLKHHEESENKKHNIIVQDNKCLKRGAEKKLELDTFSKQELTLAQNKNLNNCNSSSLRNVIENKQSENDCIIITDNKSKRKTTDKLAPLFTKRRKKDPKVLEARRLFLQPDMVDSSNKNINRKVTVQGVLPFPLIGHITQLSDSTSIETNSFNIPKKISNGYVPTINVNNFKDLLDLTEKKSKTVENIIKPKVQDVLTDVETYCSNAKEMWNAISCIAKEHRDKTVSPKTRIKKNKQSGRKEKVEYESKNQFEYCNWTHKYRPKSSREVVGNEEAVTKLKEWLLNQRTTYTNEDVSSDDEFYSSESSNSKVGGNNQVAVLLGPHGCGKTASVYAIAEELGYTVLELNASSRRTGKKLLKEYEEATKSHQIKKGEQKSVFCNVVSDEITPRKIPQYSLILIEDIDIVFEEDEGFISATYQLVSNSKRPVVMTCRDVCPHLNKMAPQQNRIHFQNAVGNRVSALLELISLAETGYRLPSGCITELLESGDLRKAILQLQYLLLSGPPPNRILEQTINFKKSFWQNMQCFVYKPAIKVSKKLKKKKIDDSTLTDVANKLDNIVLMSSLIEIEDSALNLWEIKTQPNVSLIENTATYSASKNTSLEIAEWIASKSGCRDQLNDYNGVSYRNKVMLKKQLNETVNSALSHTTSLLLDRQILATDYLPSVRAICRAEEARANTNTKRGNRFFHYLHNLKAPSTLFKPNILTAACKMMYDTADNNVQTSKDNSTLT